MKEFIKNIPVLGKVLISIYRSLNQGAGFKGSNKYWEERYAKGGTSGSGSYGRLARFKAEVINAFVDQENVKDVMEFGCGDGHQLSLANYRAYIGLDVSSTAIALCQQKFSGDKTKKFIHYTSGQSGLPVAELTLSLDVIYHLIEDEVFEGYMKDLFKHASRFVIIYASDRDGEQRYHERMRNFTRWIAQHETHWGLLKKIPNDFPYDINNPEETSQSDFFIFKKK